MNKKYLIVVFAVVIIGFALLFALSLNSSITPQTYTYNIIAEYPHDTSAYTQGLVFDNGSLFESTGGDNTSYLRRINLENGSVSQEYKLPGTFYSENFYVEGFFGEGLAVVNDKLIQLTWLNHIGFIYDKETFSLLGNFSYTTQGWGLTYDGEMLIMSDGSPTLTFVDPVTFEMIRQINVTAAGILVTNLNELEYVNGDVYANIWKEEKIAIINPLTGVVKGWINLEGLYQPKFIDDVLNGIAYDQETNRLFVTGKYWPKLYQIEVISVGN